MEFISSLGSEVTDRFSNGDVSNIRLYVYEWIIRNYSMMKNTSEAAISPVFLVGPCENMEFQLFLSALCDDTMKIEVKLSKKIKLSEDMKAKENNCPLMSKRVKYILDLEFIGASQQPTNCFMSLPYLIKYMRGSKAFVWLIDQNVSQFVHNDSLTVRAKLSMRFYSKGVLAGKSAPQHPIKMLMNDMKDLFNNRYRFSDIIIEVAGTYVPSHKSILYSQCPCFVEMAKSNTNSTLHGASPLRLYSDGGSIVGNNVEVLHLPDENVEVLLLVLHFVYCKQLCVTDTASDFAIYDFATRYGIHELSRLLMPRELKVSSEIKVEHISYIWYVENFSSISQSSLSPTQSPEFKTKVGNNTVSWNVILLSLEPQTIILNLQRINSLNLDVKTSFKLAICEIDGSIHDVKEFKHLFTSRSDKNYHPGFIKTDSRFQITPGLLYNDTLIVRCELSVSNGELLSNLKYTYPGAYLDVQVEHWIDSLYDLLTTTEFSDASLVVEEKLFKVHQAILSVRSPVFARMFENDMMEKRSRCAYIDDITTTVMKLFLRYIYTGRINSLTMSDAIELYIVADKYEVMGLKTKCSEFIMHNMNEESACKVLILSDLYNEEEMENAAKTIIFRNAAQTLLVPDGIELLTNHPILAHDILETLSVVFRSLPYVMDSADNA